jgi:hypothetical protein
MLGSFGSKDLQRGRVQVGVVPGDILLAHSSLDSLLGSGERRQVSLALSRTQWGLGGPSACRPSRSARVSSLRRDRTGLRHAGAVSRRGAITEVFCCSPDVIRGQHPTSEGGDALPRCACFRRGLTEHRDARPACESVEAECV